MYTKQYTRNRKYLRYTGLAATKLAMSTKQDTSRQLGDCTWVEVPRPATCVRSRSETTDCFCSGTAAQPLIHQSRNAVRMVMDSTTTLTSTSTKPAHQLFLPTNTKPASLMPDFFPNRGAARLLSSSSSPSSPPAPACKSSSTRIQFTDKYYAVDPGIDQQSRGICKRACSATLSRALYTCWCLAFMSWGWHRDNGVSETDSQGNSPFG